MYRLVLIIAGLALAAPALAGTSGLARVVNGDTLWIGETEVRLWGIDAPELKQTCRTNKGREQRCGELARQSLERIVRGQTVTCKGDQRDGSGRLLAVCQVGPFDVNEQMVADGWALADRKNSQAYVRAESFAKARKEGLWRGTFQAPWAWRKANP